MGFGVLVAGRAVGFVAHNPVGWALLRGFAVQGQARVGVQVRRTRLKNEGMQVS